MTRHLLAGASALAFVVAVGFSAAHANPTAKDNDFNYDSDIGNVYNSVYVGISQDASADGYAGASADGNTYGSDTYGGAEGVGGEAGYNGAYVNVAVEVGNVAIISENEMHAYVSNSGDVYAYSYDGSASAATGDASQNDYQQQYAAGLFNNALNTGLGNVQQQGNAVAVNVDTLNFNGSDGGGTW
jgi:hypothetical protein